MARKVISGGGTFTSKNISDINSDFAELYAGTSGQTLASPTITGTVAGGASYTAPTLTAITVTGTGTMATGMTITTPVFPTGGVGFTNATSGTITLSPPTGALGTVTVSLPAATDTLVGKATTDTLTNKTITGAIVSDYKVLAAPITYTSNVTPAVITGFSYTVVAGTYIFDMNLPTVMTTVGGLTLEFVLTTAVLTSIQYQSYAATASDNTTAVSTTGTTTTSATKVFDSKTAAYTYVRIFGSMVVGTGGTFAWHGCQNTSASGGDVTTLPIGAVSQLTRVA